MIGEQAPARHAALDIAFLRQRPLDELHARPHAAGILPASARSAEPLAEDGAGGDHAAFGLFQRSGHLPGLAGGPHADADEAGQEVGAYRQARAFGDVVDFADQLEAAARPDHLGEHIAEFLLGTFQPGRDDAGGDHGGFEQAQVIAGKVEDFLQRSDFRGAAQVHADEAQHGLIDDAEVGLDRRARDRIAPMHGQVDGDVEDFGAFGVIHAQEEDVAPGGVREVHAHGGFLGEDGEGAGRILAQQLAADAQGLIGGVADAEHPLVAADAADAAPHLVGERLKAQVFVCRGQCAGELIAGSVLRLRSQEGFNGLFKPAVEVVLVARIRNAAAGRGRHAQGHVEPVDGVEEEERPHALVEVGAAAAEAVELGGVGQQIVQRRAAHEGLERLVAHRGIGGGDHINQRRSHKPFPCLLFIRLRLGREQFDELRQDFLAVLAGHGQGELRREDAVLYADVVACPLNFEGEVFFALGQFGQRPAEREEFARAQCGDLGLEQFHHGGRQHVHAEVAQVVPRPEARYDEGLLGLGGGGLFEDSFDFIEPGLLGHAPAAHRAVEGQLAFARGLDGGDGALVGRGGAHELFGTACLAAGHVEVIANEVEERITGDEAGRSQDRVAIAAGMGLFYAEWVRVGV